MQNTFDNSSSFGLSYALNRRKFIKLSAMYSTSLLVVPALACKPSKESLRFGFDMVSDFCFGPFSFVLRRNQLGKVVSE